MVGILLLNLYPVWHPYLDPYQLVLLAESWDHLQLPVTLEGWKLLDLTWQEFRQFLAVTPKHPMTLKWPPILAWCGSYHSTCDRAVNISENHHKEDEEHITNSNRRLGRYVQDVQLRWFWVQEGGCQLSLLALPKWEPVLGWILVKPKTYL